MPPKRPKNAKDLVEQEGRILLAISALKNNHISSIRKAAEVYNVPRSTLQERLKGSIHRNEARANGYKLTPSEEELLIQWITSLDRRGAAPRPSHVREIANLLLEKRASPAQTVGEKWVYNFIKRHDEIKTRFARRYNHQRAKCEDPKIMQEWFDIVQTTIMTHGVANEDIYNFDETGFAMGLVATARVVTRADIIGRPYLVQPGNREWVTSVECVSSTGWVLPPCLIFKGKVHMEAWYENNTIPLDWRIEVSDNGWTNDQIGLRWLQKIFIPSTAGRVTGRYRLLILDGHGSHLTPQFDQICSENDIIPICMPAHSSHLLQPLDVGCFSPLKRAYGRLIENKMRLGFNHIDKLDFLEVYPQARTEIFSASNIISGFRATGLIPFNPERVLSQLNIRLKTPTPPGSRCSNSTPKTPHNLKQLKKQEDMLKKLISMNNRSPSSPLERSLGYILKGTEIALYEGFIKDRRIKDLEATVELLLQKKKRSKRQIEAPQGLSIQEGQEAFISNLTAENTESSTPTAASTAPTAEAAGQPPKRAPPRCSNCHIVGHRRNQCPIPLST